MVTAEDTVPYLCEAHGEYRVPVEYDCTGPWAGVWVVPAGDCEKCPRCGAWGKDLTADLDTYWNAASRSGEEAEEEWLEPSLTNGERQRG